jgi:PAS domain S-box-containing protein
VSKSAIFDLNKDQLNRLILNNITDTVYVFDLNLNYVYVSPSAINLLGFTSQEILSRSIDSFLSQNEYIKVKKILRERLEEEKRGRGDDFECIIPENRQKKKDGNWIWVERKLSFLRDESGEAIGVLAIARDITEKKDTQQALKESEERFRLAFKTSPDSIVLTRLSDGLILEVNDGFKEMTGYTDEEVIGKTSNEIYLWENESDRNKMVELLQKNGAVNNLDFSFRGKNGQRFETLLSAVVIMINNEPHLITIVRDITETKKLMNAVLRSQKLESLGLLAGGIAHDFNNLLAGIYGYIDMAMEKNKDKTVAALLNNSVKSIDRARSLSHQLLTFAKGGEPVKRIGKLFPFLEDVVKFSLSGSAVRPNFKVEEDLKMCEFDKNQISQVVDNIIINAQQAMPLGGTIDIAAKNVSSSEINILKEFGNRDFIELSITDSGIGMPPNILANIFDPFFTTKEKGHGLGLSTAYSIINRHGGTIKVDSVMGEGTTFSIYLPAAEKKSSETEESQTKVTHQGKGKILIMDDEEILRDVLKSILMSFGYEVVTTEDGQQAIRVFREDRETKNEIVAMIFDLTINGGMGGKEAVKEIKKMDKQIPVFVASGYASDAIIANPQEYGFADSIGKPFSINELKEMLAKHVAS